MARVPVQREVFPTGEARGVEAEDGQHQQRQMQKREERHGVESEPALHTRGSLSRRRKTHEQHGHERHQRHRDGRAEGPVARGGELVLHQVADHDGAAAAQQVGREIGAQARDEDQDRAGDDAGARERHDDAQDGGQRPRAQIGGGFQQRGIEPLQRGVDGQHHERQIAVDQAEQHRAIVIEQRQRGVDDAERLQGGVDQAGVAQQEHPGVGAHQEAGPEGQHHQLQIEILAARRAAR